MHDLFAKIKLDFPTGVECFQMTPNDFNLYIRGIWTFALQSRTDVIKIDIGYMANRCRMKSDEVAESVNNLERIGVITAKQGYHYINGLRKIHKQFKFQPVEIKRNQLIPNETNQNQLKSNEAELEVDIDKEKDIDIDGLNSNDSKRFQMESNETNQNQTNPADDLDFLDRIAKTPMAKEYSKVIDLRTKFAEFCEAFVAEPNESRNAAWREFYNLVFWQQSDVTSDQLIQCAKNYHEYMEEAGRLKKYMAAFLRDKIYKEFLVKPKYVKPVAKMNKVEKSIHEAVQMRKAKYGQ